jgi:hypothetical protein
MLSKMKTSIVVAALAVAFSPLNASSVVASDAHVSVQAEAVRASLAGLPAVEIPVRAAALVAAAPQDSKALTANLILQEVLEKRPQMAIQLVASLVRVAPEIAPNVAHKAIVIVPQFSKGILRAAAISAPTHAPRTAFLASMAFPNNSSEISQIVSLAVPSAAARVDALVSTSLRRIVSGALAQTVNGGGNFATSSKPIRYFVPVEIIAIIESPDFLKEEVNEETGQTSLVLDVTALSLALEEKVEELKEEAKDEARAEAEAAGEEFDETAPVSILVTVEEEEESPDANFTESFPAATPEVFTEGVISFDEERLEDPEVAEAYNG